MSEETYKIRIKYAKGGVLKYIGHLDLMRFFQKVFKRAGVDVAYSQGFSPHQLMSFAAPLALGVTSEGEYFDAQMNSLISSDEYVRIFNEQMVDGVYVKDVILLPEKAKKAMSIVAASDYVISFSDESENIKDIKDKVLSVVPHLMEKE
jgi:radical SAM-linked protein